MNNTAIGWTQKTVNAWSGCEPVSPGCKYCYAETLSEQKRGTPAFPRGFELTYRWHKLSEMRKLKEPSLIFFNSMTDLFWEKIPFSDIDRVVDEIEACPQHEVQVLTKRDRRLVEYSRYRKLPSNFWAGVSVESQTFIHRIRSLQEVEADVRFVSVEPLLSRLDFRYDSRRQATSGMLDGIHWVITGGESGNHLMDPRIREQRALVDYDDRTRRWTPKRLAIDWIRDIRDLCVEASVAYFHKQWGGARPDSGGRELDGRAWDQFPRLPRGGGVNAKVQNTAEVVGRKRLPIVGQGDLF